MKKLLKVGVVTMVALVAGASAAGASTSGGPCDWWDDKKDDHDHDHHHHVHRVWHDYDGDDLNVFTVDFHL